jgi:hypothetical protein
MSTKRATEVKLDSHHIRNIIIFEQFMKKQGQPGVLDKMDKEHVRSTLMKLRFPKKTETNKIHDFSEALKKAIPESIPQGTPPTPEPGSAEKKTKAKMIKEMNKLGELRFDPDARERTGLPFAGVDFESAEARFNKTAKMQHSTKGRSKSASKKGGRKTRKNRM